MSGCSGRWDCGARRGRAGDQVSAPDNFQRATEIWQEAYRHQMQAGLERAKQAKRYEPRQFPYMNLGRIHVRQGRWWDALREFEEAVRLAPGDAELRRALHSLRARLN